MKSIAAASLIVLSALILILTGCMGPQRQVVVTEPVFSSDGERIVFVSNADGDAELYLVNADGSNLQKLTDNDDIDVSPAWSPDGTMIVFVSNRNGSFELYRMNADGSSVELIPTDLPEVE